MKNPCNDASYMNLEPFNLVKSSYLTQILNNPLDEENNGDTYYQDSSNDK